MLDLSVVKLNTVYDVKFSALLSSLYLSDDTVIYLFGHIVLKFNFTPAAEAGYQGMNRNNANTHRKSYGISTKICCPVLVIVNNL